MSDVVFRRVRGRIVPIKKKESQSKAPGAVALAAGAGLALDGARKQRIYEKGGVTIDRARFSYQPYTMGRLGDKLTMKKDGHKVASAWWHKSPQGAPIKDAAGFAFLKTEKGFRKQGASGLLTKVAAMEMQKSGVKGIWNKVLHTGAMKVNKNAGDSFYSKTVNGFKPVQGNGLRSNLFRLTKLNRPIGVMDGFQKPTFTRASKVKMGVGLGVAALGLLSMRKRDGK